MGELSRRGVKAFAVLSFMAFTSCAIYENVAGSSPAVCARGRVAPGQCETVVVMAHMEMTTLAENCTVGGNRLSVMVLHM